MGVKFVVAACALLLVIGLKTTPGVAERLPESSVQKTAKDKLYSKEQATRGAEQYVKFCEQCHTPEKVPAGKKPGPPVQGPKFLEAWVDRPVGELYSTIYNTMPSDGSTSLSVDQALDAVAHILQLNGYPAGTAPLKNDDVMKKALIVR